MSFRFNPEIRTQKFDGAHEGEMILCEVPSRDASRPNRYVIPAELLGLLQQFDGDKNTAEVIKEHVRNHPTTHTAESLAKLIYKYCVPKKLLLESGINYIPPEPVTNRSDYLYIKVKLLPSKVIGMFSKPLGVLFKKEIFSAVIMLFLLSIAFFFLRILPQYEINISELQGFDFLKVTLLMTVFNLIHELGHAAALAHFGSTNASLGWGLYLVFPVFYTDLSDAWKLPKAQRALVDIGGIYFHGIIIIILCAILLAVPSQLLVYCVFGITIQIASSLNPFLRMDAYWVVNDLFGISDLSKRALNLGKRFLYRIFRKSHNHLPSRSETSLNRRASIFLNIYCLLSVGFFLVIFQFVFLQILFKLLPSYPGVLLGLWARLSDQPINVPDLIDHSIGALWKTLAVIGFLIFVFRLIKRLADFAYSTLRPGISRPAYPTRP